MLSYLLKRSMSHNTIQRMINNAEVTEKRLIELKTKVSHREKNTS